jgi:hypothetical protein
MDKVRWIGWTSLLLAAGVSAVVVADPQQGDKPAPEPPANGTAVNGNSLPRFTEEREAAAVQFARKHVPELQPLLDKLKSADVKKYREEICEIFQTAEFLGELRDQDPKRHDLELDIWKTQTRSLILVAKVGQAADEEKPKLLEELQDAAKKLVDLDMQVLRLRVGELEKELTDAREQLAKGEEKREALNKERYQKLFEQAKSRKMMP